MKTWSQLFCAGAILLAAVSAGAAEPQRRAALPEMMLYEAAEQAVEDGYGRIIPESEETADAGDEQIQSATEQAGEESGSKKAYNRSHTNSAMTKSANSNP